MKLKQYIINWNELQDYLDKFQDKIKFIFCFNQRMGNINSSQFLLIIDEA